MSLRDQLTSHPKDEEQDTITFIVNWTESTQAEVKCHHAELLWWMCNIMNILQKMTKDMELNKYEKIMLLDHWIDDLGDIKDERFPHNDDEDDK